MESVKKVVLLGSGGLRIGQAGEFDYSGSQAIKALKQEGIYTVLINPNIATVQTDNDMADKVYFQPLNLPTVTKILAKEKPDAIMLSFGGQTALNLGLELHDKGVLDSLDITVLGTPVSAIKATEDRELFKQALAEIGTKTARSISAYTIKEALSAARKIGYPVMMRAGYSLGGLGSGRINNETELKHRAEEVLKVVPQVLIEEYLAGWKEIEYEIVRDMNGNAITVCSMENFDPMGVHTGESIVVAPTQTLTEKESKLLRDTAIKTISHLGIIGECNIQYALNPATGDYRVIEVNARLSRSSALASKATGYPLAFVAANIALGKRLGDLKNVVAGNNSAAHEPTLDYIALKVPRWDFTKFKTSDHHIGSEMKSIGEVMALGKTFPEVLQKALRMLNIGADGFSIHPYTFVDPLEEITRPTDRRIFALYEALRQGITIKKLNELSNIDPWFLTHIKAICDTETTLKNNPVENTLLRTAKQLGFSDTALAVLTNTTEEYIRNQRLKEGILPALKQVGATTGKQGSTTNYLYATYHADTHDVAPLGKRVAAILGSGPYSIGSSVEFDWSAVNTAKTLRQHKYHPIMINSNPETVSTDFDHSDRLYFDELTLERIRDIADFEQPYGIVVSVGGQIANNFALPLHKARYPILGTSPANIDRAEDRQKFSSMLNDLDIDQPDWQEVSSLEAAKQFIKKVGFPVIIRPSYVLSGGAMNVVTSEKEMELYLEEATRLSPNHPVVISQFITDAKELEIDGVASKGEMVIYAISEHIENAGVHSGDATVAYPAQRLYIETVRRAKQITHQIVGRLKITGPFNIQFIAKDNELKVIECNVRASRSFPFVSKVSGHNFIKVATEVILNKHRPSTYQTLELDYVAVKSPQFSYNRLKGADPVAGVEMASTGEVACFGDNLEEAFYTSWLATEQQVKGRDVFISLPDKYKPEFVEVAAELSARGWTLYTTAGTHAYFKKHGISTQKLFKIQDKKEPSVTTAVAKKKLSLMINVPSAKNSCDDAYCVRRLAIDNHIPLMTNGETGLLLLKCLADPLLENLTPKSVDEYTSQRKFA